MPPGADEGEAAERFAAELMDRWGVGDASCNDGVLLLLTLQPRQVCPSDTAAQLHAEIIVMSLMRYESSHAISPLDRRALSCPLN